MSNHIICGCSLNINPYLCNEILDAERMGHIVKCKVLATSPTNKVNIRCAFSRQIIGMPFQMASFSILMAVIQY